LIHLYDDILTFYLGAMHGFLCGTSVVLVPELDDPGVGAVLGVNAS
jgi:hypothetical protein